MSDRSDPRLVDGGILERRRYKNRPPRDEYVLTECGRDFRPVLWAFVAYGNRHFAPEGPSVIIVDRETGAVADPMLVDRVSGRELKAGAFRAVPGPAANNRLRAFHGAAAPERADRHDV